MKLLSWNVNGLRAAQRKGFLEWMQDSAPDVLCLQEIKAREEDLPEALRQVPGYHACFHSAKKKGYSGVAIYARRQPDEWFVGMGEPEFDDEGRVLGARFGDLVVLSAYFPNSQQEGTRLDYRLRFGAAMRKFLRRLQKQGHHVALGGDFNVAHERIDIARPDQNMKSPGFLPEERQWMAEFLAAGYLDTWRLQNPETADVYSWWSYRAGSRQRNVGWRLDYFCVDQEFSGRLGAAEIVCDVLGSDHCPVGLSVDL